MAEKKVTDKQELKIKTTSEKVLEKHKKKVESDVKTAGELIITNDEQREAVIIIGKEAQEQGKFFKALFEEEIGDAFNLHRKLTAKRNFFTDAYADIVKSIKSKIGIYDKKVADEKHQLDLKKQKDEQAKRDRVLAAAQKKVAGLIEDVGDLAEQRNLLDEKLETGDCDDDEAAAIRSQIAIIDEAIENKKDKVDIVETKVVETVPAPAPVSSKAKPTSYDVEVTDPKALCKAIGEGKAPASLVSKFDTSNIAKDRKRGIIYDGIEYFPNYAKSRL